MSPATAAWNDGLAVGRAATEPPEARGGRRDDVRLLVSRPGHAPVHDGFRALPGHLRAGDVLVINTSATWAAALDTVGPDGPLRVHLATSQPDDRWLVELRHPSGPVSLPFTGDAGGLTLPLAEGGVIEVGERFRGSGRLWVARVRVAGDLPGYLARWGRPIRYAYISQDWPIEAYQTVYATIAGSAEMPSAGRPFTPELITALVASGITVAPLLLHTGVSSLEGDEAPYPEWFSVPATTARLVNQARAAGRRVVAVGTTVVRALESAIDPRGAVVQASGWTDRVITPSLGVRAVDALLTGFHDPSASHLQMLRALASDDLLRDAYLAANASGYRWHEFGDSHLILPHD